MKAFVASVTVAILLGVAAHFALHALPMSSAEVLSSGNVRLGR